MQARFTVQVLALEAQVLRGVPGYRCAFPQAAAPGAGSTAPDGVAVAVGHALRQAVQFRVVPEDLRMLPMAVNTRQRFIAVFGVDILHRRVRVTVAGFAHHLQTRPCLMHGIIADNSEVQELREQLYQAKQVVKEIKDVIV